MASFGLSGSSYSDTSTLVSVSITPALSRYWRNASFFESVTAACVPRGGEDTTAVPRGQRMPAYTVGGARAVRVNAQEVCVFVCVCVWRESQGVECSLREG